MILFKRGISKLRIGFIFVIVVLAIISSTFAALGASDSKNENIDNMKITSETKNNFKVTFYPLYVGLVDKEYNVTIQNLEDKERKVNIDAFFKAITKDIDIILPGSIQLSYLTDLTKAVSNYSTTCTDKQVALSQGKSNETTKTITTCTTQDNPITITYKGWKAYPVNEVRDKIKQEITLHKTNENGKITLTPNGLVNFNLKFKTRTITKEDGTYGNDGDFGLLLDGISFHPTFNVSYNKRYLLNITASDAINTNFTHNISFAFTGNSTQLGSENIFRANVLFLGCNHVHVIFNETKEIDREIEECNSSNFRIYFRNQVNMTRNQTLNENYSIYYEPVDTIGDPQPPRDWSAIWMIGSAHFDDGQNDTLYKFDNTTTGNSTWRNVSGNGYVELRAQADPNDGCLVGNDITNTTEPNLGMEFLLQRVNDYSSDSGNKAFGFNDRKCSVSPNSLATGFFIKDSPAGLDNGFSARNANFGVLNSSTLEMGRPGQGAWQLMSVNRTTSSGFNINVTGFLVVNIHNNITENVPDSAVPIRPLLRSEAENAANFNLDEIRIYQLVSSPPNYAVIQQNRTLNLKPVVLLRNPPNQTINGSRSHVFNANYSDDFGLANATLYNNISGIFLANQTINISGMSNSTNFSINLIVDGGYTWNVLACDNTSQCSFAPTNFTFTVNNPPTDINLINPLNGNSNTSTSHLFFSNASDARALANASLYYNISGNWLRNQTVTRNGTFNTSSFNVASISPGTYEWNVEWCDADNNCSQAVSNFTFKVQTIVTKSIEVRACTAENRVNTANTYNDSCEGTYPAPCGSNTTNDFLSCDDGNLETQTYRKDKFTGLHIQAFNNSIIDCASVGSVSLCYRWWTLSGNPTNCLVAADANGNSSYSTVNSTCPNIVNMTCPEASPTPALVCTDITSLENWTCSSFFGTNGTRAVARTELSATNPGPSQMLRTDALFFNITYGR